MNVRDLTRAHSLRVVERTGGIAPYRYVISELEARTRTIVLYRDTLELLAGLVERLALPFEKASLDEIAIAHEYCHFRWPLVPERRVHRFVQRLLSLQASPDVLNDALIAHARNFA